MSRSLSLSLSLFHSFPAISCPFFPLVAFTPNHVITNNNNRFPLSWTEKTTWRSSNSYSRSSLAFFVLFHAVRENVHTSLTRIVVVPTNASPSALSLLTRPRACMSRPPARACTHARTRARVGRCTATPVCHGTMHDAHARCSSTGELARVCVYINGYALQRR